MSCLQRTSTSVCVCLNAVSQWKNIHLHQMQWCVICIPEKWMLKKIAFSPLFSFPPRPFFDGLLRKGEICRGGARVWGRRYCCRRRLHHSAPLLLRFHYSPLINWLVNGKSALEAEESSISGKNVSRLLFFNLMDLVMINWWVSFPPWTIK